MTIGTGARPVTTAKDAVRLPEDTRKMVDVVDVVVEFQDEAAIDELLQPLRTGRPATPGNPNHVLPDRGGNAALVAHPFACCAT